MYIGTYILCDSNWSQQFSLLRLTNVKYYISEWPNSFGAMKY